MPTNRDQDDEKVVRALGKMGVNITSVFDLINSRRAYPDAIPILARSMTEVQDCWIKEGIVRALSVREARGRVDEALLDEFERIKSDAPPNEQSLKWAIGNALSVVATQPFLERIARLACDKRHGKAREMLAVALGNMKGPLAVNALTGLLDDEEMVGHALIGLRRLKMALPREKIEPLLGHSKLWVRNEAKKAMSSTR